MARTVKRLWMFSWGDYEAAAAYLEQMAASGLLLSQVKALPMIGSIGIIAVFEKGRPQRRKYCVDIFPGKGEEEARHYLQLAADSGWEIIDAVNGIGFYQSAEETEPVPLQTDWRMQYREIRRTYWRGEGVFGIAAMVLLYFLLKTGLSIGDILSKPSANSLFLAIWLIFGMLSLIRTVVYTLQSEIALRRDRPLRSKTLKEAKLWGGIYSILAVLFVGTWLYKFGGLYVQLFADGNPVIQVCSILMAAGIAGIAVISRLKSYEESRGLKTVCVLLEILVGAALLTYCASGCEIV